MKHNQITAIFILARKWFFSLLFLFFFYRKKISFKHLEKQRQRKRDHKGKKQLTLSRDVLIFCFIVYYNRLVPIPVPVPCVCRRVFFRRPSLQAKKLYHAGIEERTKICRTIITNATSLLYSPYKATCK
jgi:hypothetical protein